jgi:hypothetical protein
VLVVVGGQAHGIGKTAVVAGLIGALPEAGWTAVKITPHSHRARSRAAYTLTQELNPDSRTDSARYLAAGARRSFWLRATVGQLGQAVPALELILETSPNAIFESNSVLEFFRPELYLLVLDFSVQDFKESSRRFLERADALVLIESCAATPRNLAGKPCFPVQPPDYTSAALAAFVRARM